MYQISVALNGSFLFRTEWEQDKSRAENSLQHLADMLTGEQYHITMNFRPNVTWSMTCKESAADCIKLIEDFYNG